MVRRKEKTGSTASKLLQFSTDDEESRNKWVSTLNSAIAKKKVTKKI